MPIASGRDTLYADKEYTSGVELITIAQYPTTVLPPPDSCCSAQSDREAVSFRTPRTQDGPAITALIRDCPPLDPNSAYCNLLQCSHFADTCVVAEQAGQLVGWISAYRPPSDTTRFFVWQVAVHASARGEGLAGRMLDALLARPSAQGVTHLITSITEDNDASWALFGGFARKRDLSLTKTPLFERNAHFGGTHDTEWQAEIGPIPAQPEQNQRI